MSAARSSLNKNKKSCSCGASGCVIYPGLDCGEADSCSGKSKCQKPIATKFFVEDENYTNEMNNFDKNNKQLKRLDKEEDYFLSSYKTCGKIEESEEIKKICTTIPKKKIKEEKLTFTGVNLPANYEEKEIGEFDWMRRGSSLGKSSLNSSNKKLNPSYNAINFSYLGKPMQNILPNLNGIEKIKECLISVKNVFVGVKILNEAKIYHCDIKPQNLVLDERDKQFKIIDFGNAIFDKPTKKLKSEWQSGDDIEGYTAGYVSPEYFYSLYGLLPNVLFFGDIENIESVDNNIVRYLKLYRMEKNKMKAYSDISIIPDKYYEQLEPAKTYIKNDIWSLGCVLKKILSELLVKLDEAKSKDVQIFLEKVIIHLCLVIKKLVIMNVDLRPTASQALDLYDDFLKIIEDTTRHSTRKGGRKRRKTLRRKTRKGRKSN